MKPLDLAKLAVAQDRGRRFGLRAARVTATPDTIGERKADVNLGRSADLKGVPLAGGFTGPHQGQDVLVLESNGLNVVLGPMPITAGQPDPDTEIRG